MGKIQKASSQEVKLKDIAQVSLVIDKSSSMRNVSDEAKKAIQEILQQFACEKGLILAISEFGSSTRVTKDFCDDIVNYDYSPTDNSTCLYKGIYDALNWSVQVAKASKAMGEQIEAQHVVVVITDGDNNTHFDYEERSRKLIEEVNADTTFILLNFSNDSTVGNNIGLCGINFGINDFSKAMQKVRTALGQISENIIKKLPPDQNLCLPPSNKH